MVYNLAKIGLLSYYNDALYSDLDLLFSLHKFVSINGQLTAQRSEKKCLFVKKKTCCSLNRL